MILPEEFKKIFIQSHGEEAFDRFNASLALDRRTTAVRFNPQKIDADRFRRYMEDLSGGEVERVPWCTTGYYLSRRPNFTLDPLFHTGSYYVQDASSMFLEAAFNAMKAADPSLFQPGRRIRILDMCAAPGGKSTHLLQLAGDAGLVVSNEVIGSRASILRGNIELWGSSNCVVTSSDSEKFAQNLPEWFDIVLTDVPCSGEGMFRKMESGEGNAAIENWSLESVKLCASRARRIVSAAIKSIRPGGFLIYSTCTFNRCENDDMLSFIEDNFDAVCLDMDFSLSGGANDCPSSCGIRRTQSGGRQFIPGLVRGEGQFCALMQIGKRGNESRERSDSCRWGEFVKVSQGGLVKIVPSPFAASIERVAKSVRVLSSGTALGYMKGRDFIPDHGLATSAVINAQCASVNCKDGVKNFKGADANCRGEVLLRMLPEMGSIGRVEISVTDSLKFLAKEPLVLSDAPKGVLLLTFMGKGLGFVKNLGNRCNSLLPSSRRILNK